MNWSYLGVFKFQQLGYRMFIRIMFLFVFYLIIITIIIIFFKICNTIMEAAIDI